LSSDAFSRQRLLPEVGEVGQLRLSRGTVRVPAGPGAAAASDYLRRAGVGQVQVVAEPPPEFPHQRLFRYAPSGAFGFGTWQALTSLRELLGVPARK
jgi:molybdopterin/thiamine biosynthesis adenylyltransferase